MKAALPLMLMTAAALPAAAMAQSAPSVVPVTGPVVNLSVTESVDSAPDLATVGTGVQTRALTAKEAMSANAAAVDKLIAAILKAGIDRKDVQTSGINLNPQYDYNNRTDGQGPKFIGYEASNQLTVKIRKIAAAGDVIDRMVGAGATNINGPTFGIADDTAVLEKARTKAIAASKARAEYYARQSGYRSVRLLSISEGGETGRVFPAPMMVRADSAAKGTSVEPGQLSTSVTLSVQYVLEK
ncbi:SIMPL domain-containing protein [Sphingobium sufflavum]|uniref:SIMPL domain-containing protein n=1 Tax=Sphingobium sufflavum TaxID=1129547 RepID=UPI001F16B31B|nr:SIMPL domain-containing protein [Sphingobium sufflavum]MCE7798452.1 SIMPL domain-containing protein [Sphingobium sufflavum]